MDYLRPQADKIMSLRATIYNYIKSQYPLPVHKGDIGRKAVNEWGYENENAGRRCRELCNDGYIERIMFTGGCVGYRWIPQEQRKTILPEKGTDEYFKEMSKIVG